MGLVVNKTIDTLTIEELYTLLKIEPAVRANRPQPVHFGDQGSPGQPELRGRSAGSPNHPIGLLKGRDDMRALGAGESVRVERLGD